MSVGNEVIKLRFISMTTMFVIETALRSEMIL